MGGVVIPLNMQRCIDNFKEKAGLYDIEKYLNPYHQNGFIGDLEAGKINVEQFYEECLKHCRPGTSKETVAACFYSLLDGVNPDALRLFRDLKGKFELYVLSNNNPISMQAFNDILSASGMRLEDIFSGTFFSYQLHMLKPSEEFFQYAIRETGADPGEILFIDDSQVNIRVASSLGMRTLLYVPQENNLYSKVTETLDYLQNSTNRFLP